MVQRPRRDPGRRAETTNSTVNVPARRTVGSPIPAPQLPESWWYHWNGSLARDDDTRSESRPCCELKHCLVVSFVPAPSRQTAVTTRNAFRRSRRRCWQEGAAPPPFLHRPHSTPPVSLRSVPHVLACRAVRSVPRDPGWRAPPDRSPCHRHARAIGIARRRSGSRPRPARHARAGRHSEGLPLQSCRSRHEQSGADRASRPSTATLNVGGWCTLASVASSSPRALTATARSLRSTVDARKA